jgi:hypothetical protein
LLALVGGRHIVNVSGITVNDPNYNTKSKTIDKIEYISTNYKECI